MCVPGSVGGFRGLTGRCEAQQVSVSFLNQHTPLMSAIGVTHLAFPAVHRLLVELLSDAEVDFSGAYGGGGLDVELLSVLSDLHVWFGCSSTSHFPEHSVHTWVEQF